MTKPGLQQFQNAQQQQYNLGSLHNPGQRRISRKSAAAAEETSKKHKQIKKQLIKSNLIQHNYEKTLFDPVGRPLRTGYR